MRELFGKPEFWLLCFGELKDDASRLWNRENGIGRAQLEVGMVFVPQETGDR